MPPIDEETGINVQVTNVLGIRSGVIQDKISDNLIIFAVEYVSGDPGKQFGYTQYKIYS